MPCEGVASGLVQYCSQHSCVIAVYIGFLGFLIEWHINLNGLFNAKPILVEWHYWYCLTYTSDISGYLFKSERINVNGIFHRKITAKTS